MLDLLSQLAIRLAEEVETAVVFLLLAAERARRVTLPPIINTLAAVCVEAGQHALNLSLHANAADIELRSAHLRALAIRPRVVSLLHEAIHIAFTEGAKMLHGAIDKQRRYILTRSHVASQALFACLCSLCAETLNVLKHRVQ